MSQTHLQSFEDLARTLTVLQGLRDNILKLSEGTRDHFLRVRSDLQEQEGRVTMLMEHAAGAGREINKLAAENTRLSASLAALEEKVDAKDLEIRKLADTIQQLNLRVSQVRKPTAPYCDLSNSLTVIHLVRASILARSQMSGQSDVNSQR